MSTFYWGESSRTGYCRGKEHLEDMQRGVLDNPMVKHGIIHHPGLEHQYKMGVATRFKTPFSRQIAEAAAIELCTAGIILNSKSEWNGSKLPSHC